jgi:hypothetical protein
VKLKAHSIKTDNDGIKNKIELRKKATEHIRDICVLDLFAGNNKIWNGIKTKKYYGIEIEKGKGKNLTGNNQRVIPSLDLSAFNVIDCDSYGVPFNQIWLLTQNKTLKSGTVIIYTAITNKVSSLNKKAIEKQGISNMYKKCKTLFNGKAIEFFYAFLHEIGVRKVYEYSKKTSFEKHYGYFVIP